MENLPYRVPLPKLPPELFQPQGRRREQNPADNGGFETLPFFPFGRNPLPDMQPSRPSVDPSQFGLGAPTFQNTDQGNPLIQFLMQMAQERKF